MAVDIIARGMAANAAKGGSGGSSTPGNFDGFDIVMVLRANDPNDIVIMKGNFDEIWSLYDLDTGWPRGMPTAYIMGANDTDISVLTVYSIAYRTYNEDTIIIALRYDGQNIGWINWTPSGATFHTP